MNPVDPQIALISRIKLDLRCYSIPVGPFSTFWSTHNSYHTPSAMLNSLPSSIVTDFASVFLNWREMPTYMWHFMTCVLLLIYTQHVLYRPFPTNALCLQTRIHILSHSGRFQILIFDNILLLTHL